MKRHALVVDDEKEFRSRYKKILKQIDVDTFEAPDALEVSNWLMREKSNIDLIILDLQIAELDGRDIFDIVQEYDAGSIPVVVSSVLPLREQRLRIPHAQGYYHKGDPDEVFLKKVKHVLGID